LETPEWNLIPTAIPQLLYMGIFSSGIGYSLQIIGQKYAEPTVASLSMSLEGVFAALGGWLIASDVLTLREIVGCVLVFAAIVLAQLPSKKQKT
jgi:drug/metabolite transporter (DMT)-like permease